MNAVAGGAACLLAGAAAVLGFAPIDLQPVALAGLAVLVHAWSSASPARCFLYGWLFGSALFLGGVSWIYVSMTQFGGMPPPLAAAATGGFCAFLALFPAAAGWLQARLPACAAVRALLLIPASWTLFEWLRGWVLSGFPWLSIGYSAPGWPLEGFAPLLGVFGVSFATMAAAGLLWKLVAGRGRAIAAIALVALLLAGEALRHAGWTQAAGEPVTTALLQGNIAQDLKFSPQRYLHILETYARLAEGTSARLIVLPETAVPRFYDQVEPQYLARLEGVARRNGGDLLLGVPLREGTQRYYNAVVTLGTTERGVYKKVHLVPFGEFIPPGFSWWLRMMQIPLSDFASGDAGQPPLVAAGRRIAVNVCYEDLFGEELAARAARSEMIVNMSNVAWFGDSLAPGQHLQIARMRALESGRMVVAATNTGITAAIDRDGRVLSRLPQFAEGRLEIAVQGYAGTTPYLIWRDWPAALGSLLVLVAAAAFARRAGAR